MVSSTLSWYCQTVSSWYKESKNKITNCAAREGKVLKRGKRVPHPLTTFCKYIVFSLRTDQKMPNSLIQTLPQIQVKVHSTTLFICSKPKLHFPTQIKLPCLKALPSSPRPLPQTTILTLCDLLSLKDHSLDIWKQICGYLEFKMWIVRLMYVRC